MKAPLILLFTAVLFSLSFPGYSQWYVLKKSKAERKEIIKFQKDENGKIIFYEVVTVDTVARDTLWKNAGIYMRSLLSGKTDKITNEQYLYGTIEGSTSFDVFAPSIISKIPDGKITYDILIDVKDKKYRYTFTNFIFYKYKQDRNLKYQLTKMTKPLEDEKYFGSQGLWNSHRSELKRRIEAQILNMKRQMVIINKPKPEAATTSPSSEEPVKRTKDW